MKLPCVYLCRYFSKVDTKTLFEKNNHGFLIMLSSVQSLSFVQLISTLWTAAHNASLSMTSSWSLLKFMSIESVMPSISSSVIPFSSHLQPIPASGSFPTSQFFASGGQSTGVSASVSVLPLNIQG